jgi:hypothetical protein
MSKFDGKAILAIEFECDELDGRVTIGGYLIKLLETLWEEGEGFSGKRPFGNSGWERDLYKPLIAAGVIRGELDEDGYIERVDDSAGAKAIFAAIAALTPATPDK